MKCARVFIVHSRRGVSDRIVAWKAIALAGGLDVVCLKDDPAAFLVVLGGDERGEGDEKQEQFKGHFEEKTGCLVRWFVWKAGLLLRCGDVKSKSEMDEFH
jgi:hypothetical protein